MSKDHPSHKPNQGTSQGPSHGVGLNSIEKDQVGDIARSMVSEIIAEALPEALPAAIDDWHSRPLHVRFSGSYKPEHFAGGDYRLLFTPSEGFCKASAQAMQGPPDPGLHVERGKKPVVQLFAGSEVFLPTGIHLAIPHGFEASFRSVPTSERFGLRVVPGQVVHSGDHEEVRVLVRNDGRDKVVISPGDVVAHFYLREIQSISFEGVEEQLLALGVPGDVLPPGQHATGEGGGK